MVAGRRPDADVGPLGDRGRVAAGDGRTAPGAGVAAHGRRPSGAGRRWRGPTQRPGTRRQQLVGGSTVVPAWYTGYRVTEDRVISKGDPAMRHRRKTSAPTMDGYKSHQLTQSVPPATGARLITALAVMSPRGG